LKNCINRDKIDTPYTLITWRFTFLVLQYYIKSGAVKLVLLFPLQCNDTVMQVFFRCELNTDPHIELWERWDLILICIHTFKGIAQMGWSSKFINCFLNVVTCLSVNVRKSTSWISGKLCLQTWWTKLLLNIYWYDIQSAKKCIYWICTLKQ
jgi:hypothetical protein